MTVTLVKLQSTTVTVIVAVFVTVTFVAVRAKKKQILNQCIQQLGNNKAKPEVKTSQNPVRISVLNVTVTVNVNVTGIVTPATVWDKEEKTWL